eukprot:GHVP01043917.1.p1 GENE.GHVP01043917.1~~GHVP01043917.1.p1  ORF type:complete len:198 (+),score=1.00 GHVP01043917.1:119-712(+)
MTDLKKTIFKLPAGSSPGPDGIGYWVYKRVPELHDTILKIINTCLKFEKVPKSWKHSCTILIYKKDDPNDPNNWLSISLQNAIYKILALLMATRLSEWCSKPQLISKSQRGFITGCDGIAEHTFLAQPATRKARNSRQGLYSVWYDLKDAFGSVPHSLLNAVLRAIDAPLSFTNLVMEIYTGATFSCRTPVSTWRMV